MLRETKTERARRSVASSDVAIERLARRSHSIASHRVFVSVYVLEAALALDIHEERVRRLHQSLELVLASLERGGRVQKIDVLSENLGACDVTCDVSARSSVRKHFSRSTRASASAHIARVRHARRCARVDAQTRVTAGAPSSSTRARATRDARSSDARSSATSLARRFPPSRDRITARRTIVSDSRAARKDGTRRRRARDDDAGDARGRSMPRSSRDR